MVSQDFAGGMSDEPNLFRSLFEHMAEGVALHAVVYSEVNHPTDYRIVDINPAYTTHTGMTRVQVVGKTSREVYGVEPPLYFDEYLVAGHYGRPNRFETYFAATDRHFSISVAPMGSGFFATIFTDITEKKRLEERRERRERTLSQIIELAPNSVAVTAMDGTLISVNRAFCEITGWTKEELVGRRTTDLNTWGEPRQREQILVCLRREGRISGVELPVRTRSGELRQLEFCGAIVEVDGESVIVSVARDITDMRAAEQARRDASLELERFFSLSLDMLCITNLEGRFLRLNPAWETVLGYPLESLVGAHFWDFVHPEDRSSTESVIQQLSAGQSKVNFTNRYRHQDGSFRWIEWRTMPFERGLVYAAARDVTERVEATEALRRGMADLERSQLVARLGSYRFYVTIGTWECSRALEDIFDISPDYIKTFETWGQLIHHEERAEMLRYVTEDVVGKGEEFDREYRIVRNRDKAVRWVHGRGALERDNDGRVLTMFGTIQDVTARHEAEQERRQLEEKLLHAQKLESLGVLAGGIAHDFNNLLTSILGNASLALDDLSSLSPVRQQLTDIEVASKRAAELCRQLLAYSGKGRFVVQPLSLNELVEEMTNLLTVSISKKVVLQYHFFDGLSAVMADATQIRQVVINLVTNASEAIGDNSGVVSVTTGTMYCDLAYLKGCYVGEALSAGYYSYVEVSDSGSGMDSETLARVFDPFFTTKFTGRGLGLAAALGIVRGHKGAIKVYSERKHGTTFKVLLPVIEGKVAPITTGEVSLDFEGSGLILVADDEDSVRSVARCILERAGYSVLEAVDGSDAVLKFREKEAEICAVVLDMIMPHLDGEACFRELRRIRADVKVLLTSGYNEQDVVSRFSGKGLAGFLQKPYSQSQLLIAIAAIIKGDV